MTKEQAVIIAMVGSFLEFCGTASLNQKINELAPEDWDDRVNAIDIDNIPEEEFEEIVISILKKYGLGIDHE